MARIRTVKPSFWTDKKMQAHTVEARLLFIGLLNYADDDGLFQADLRLVKSTVFPIDNWFSLGKIATHLVELAKSNRIGLYRHDGELYGIIHNFRKHQKINRPTESNFPKFTEASLIPHGELIEASLWEWKGMEWNGMDKQMPPSARQTSVDDLIFCHLRDDLKIDAPKACAVLRPGGSWSPHTLGCLLYALGINPPVRDPIIFAKGCAAGKSGARLEVEQYINRANALLKSFQRKLDENAA